jgi:hypothetical protein
LLEAVVDASIEQERYEAWVVREVEAGVPLPGPLSATRRRRPLRRLAKAAGVIERAGAGLSRSGRACAAGCAESSSRARPQRLNASRPTPAIAGGQREQGGDAGSTAGPCRRARSAINRQRPEEVRPPATGE